MKLNLTEDESQSFYVDKVSLQNDWLAMHTELGVRLELISLLQGSINAAYDEMIVDVNCGELLEDGKNIDGLYHAIEIMRKHGLIPEKESDE